MSCFCLCSTSVSPSSVLLLERLLLLLLLLVDGNLGNMSLDTVLAAVLPAVEVDVIAAAVAATAVAWHASLVISTTTDTMCDASSIMAASSSCVSMFKWTARNTGFEVEVLVVESARSKSPKEMERTSYDWTNDHVSDCLRGKQIISH